MGGRSHRAVAVTLLLSVALVLCLNAHWFFSGRSLETAEPLRLVVGAIFIFLVPGLLAGELLGLRGRSPLETIAIASTASLTAEIGLVAVVLLLGASIQFWVGLLLATSVLGALFLGCATLRGRPLRFIPGLIALPPGSLLERALHLACVAAPLLLGALAYGWGEQPAELAGEKYIHMMFVRYYAEMPLVLADLGLYQGLPPPNLVHFWEFLLAGWSCCVRIDPLAVFCHARMVVPVLGLAGMYLLTRLIFLDWRKSTLVFAGVLLLAAGQVVLEVGNLRWINLFDSTRGVFTFFGTAHHADPAMDILLPFSAAFLLLFLRQPRWAHGVLLAGILAADFLWHPREFLQAALYLGMLGPVIMLLPSLRRRAVITRWLATAGVLVGVAIAAAAVSHVCVGRESHFYDESALKRTALRYAFHRGEIATVRSLFQFPLHFYLASPNHPDVLSRAELDQIAEADWNLDRWWFLAAGATIVLVLLGQARDRQLAFYHLVFWLLAYCWNFSMLVILALTYSEFFHTMPRLLYLFSYLVIADAVLVLGTGLCRGLELAAFWWASKARPTMRLFRVALPSGVVIAALAVGNAAIGSWTEGGQPGAEVAAAVLNVACLALLLVVFWCEWARWNDQPALRALRRPLPLAFGLMMVCVALWPDNAQKWCDLADTARSGTGDPAWYGDKNPLGYSRELIAWARALPARHRIASNPVDCAMLTVYSPQYLCVQPVGSVIADAPERERAEKGKHPFYRPIATSSNSWSVDHAEAHAWLRERRADYVLINRHDYDSPALEYFQAHPECYELVFENSVAREAVFRTR